METIPLVMINSLSYSVEVCNQPVLVGSTKRQRPGIGSFLGLFSIWYKHWTLITMVNIYIYTNYDITNVKKSPSD